MPSVPAANFSVLQGIVTPEEVAAILAVVEDPSLEFDEDVDSVDGQATHELYLERSGSLDGVKGAFTNCCETCLPRISSCSPFGVDHRCKNQTRC